MISFLLFHHSSFAIPCDQKMETGAFDSIGDLEKTTKKDPLQIWARLFDSYSKFKTCDDGAIGEGYSQYLVSNLSQHWKTHWRLFKFMRQNPEFEKFVLSHLSSTTNPKDLRAVQTSVIHSCKPNEKDLCDKMRTTLRNALKEIKSPG